MTFNEKLKQALAENHNERINRSTVIEKKHRFSLSYRIWERKMLRDLRRNRLDNRWTLHKARHVVIIIAISAAIALSLTACATVNLVIGRFSFDDKRDHSKLYINNFLSDKTKIEEYYGLPEEDGWIIVDYSELTDYMMTKYTHSDKSVIFTQEIIREDMGNVNTENAVVEPMSLYEENDGFFIEFQYGVCGLWWIYDGYLFSVSGNLDKSELLDLAYSTKIKKI